MTRRPTLRLGAAMACALALAGCGSAAMVGVHDAPAQVTTTAPITPESAERIATRVVTDAEQAQRATGAQAATLRKQALTGTALAIADAAAKLHKAPSTATATAPVERPEPPKVLAVSRGTSWPRHILVQTTEADGGAKLDLLTSPDAATPFRLSASARMHPGATVAALDALPNGSAIVTDGADLAVAPGDLVKAYAGALAYPKPATTKVVGTADPFSMAVRANAVAQAKSFGKLAKLTQVHKPVGDPVALRLKDGGALVFAVLSRTDAITLAKGGKSLTPSPEFQRLVRKKKLSKSAALASYESVVFTVPAEGRATVVAADEVLYSAKGA